MKASELLNMQLTTDFEVSYIVEDSRKVKENSIFACISGMQVDGHQYIESAINNGARFIVAEREIECDIPFLVVKDTKEMFALLNAKLNNNPQNQLSLIGVTGTDGKTTTSCLIRDLLATKQNVAYLGTNGLEYMQINEYLNYTTPPADVLFSKMREIVEKNAEVLCMEVSSQGLDQKRCESLEFDVAIFTNLSHEHINVHGSMENYFNAKKKLFDKVKASGISLINIDDEHGLILANTLSNVMTYSLHQEADLKATNIQLGFDKTVFDLEYQNKTYQIVSPMVAKYNVYNLVSAIGTCLHLGYNIEEIQEMITHIKPIDGRMHVYTKDNVTSVVDFAHTPNSLELIIKFAKEVAKGQVSVVFGSAGGRDEEKRPLMGEVASRCADFVYITDDDPRFENPKKIMDEIAAACENDNYEIIETRKEAIKTAIVNAKPGDVVLVTGKGNEDFQIIGDKKIPYNDIEEVLKSLELRTTVKQ